MEGLRNSVGITPVMGTLFGVVVSSITGEWWWIGLGFAVGLGLEAIKRRAGRES